MAPHKNEIVMKNGLVNPNALFEYMDGCHCEDLPESPKPFGSHKEEGHHLIFTNPLIKAQRSKVLTWLRSSKYNIINMLQCQEDLFHQMSSEQIPIELINHEAAATFLDEADTLTNFAATSYTKSFYEQRLEPDQRLSRADRSRLEARYDVILEMHEEDTARVNQISVIEHSVVTGALMNYLVQRFERSLESIVRTRMAADSRILSPAIYSPDALESIAGDRLNRRIKANSWALKHFLVA